MATLKTLKIDNLSHRQARLAATYEGKSLKQFLEDVIASYIESDEKLVQFIDQVLEANAERKE